jgi:pyrroline-5-carboxylate reductase
MLAAARTLVGAEASAEGLQQTVEAGCPAVREGLGVLEERHVRGVFEEAVLAAAQRSRQMRAPSSVGA